MSHLLATQLKRSKYRLLGLVGQGQFGRVYCAIHRKTGQLVALKALERSRFSTRQFLRELRFLISLQHPNIVTCHALEHVGNCRYLVMDYCEGGTLRALMEASDRIPPALSVKLVAEVLAGLSHAHSRGIIHCDIKPENILLSLQPMSWQARISDFGIARLSQELVLEGSSMTGSPAYMAPERFYGQHSQSADLYAIGVLLFELLAGYRPFSGVPADLMSAHLNQPVNVPDSIPAPLKFVILTALQKLQARRFSSADDMLVALKSAAALCPKLMSDRSLNFSLTQSASVLPKYPLRSLREEGVRYSISRLAAVSDAVMRGDDRAWGRTSAIFTTETVAMQSLAGSQIHGREYPKGLLSASRERGEEISGARLPELVREMLVRPQGCFAITERSIYLCSNNQTRLLTQLSQPFIADLDPQGRWAATNSAWADDPTIEDASSTLRIWSLPHFKLVNAPVVYSSRPFKLLALDSRHLAALSHLIDGTRLDFFNRRSQRVGALEILVNVAQVICTAKPNQLAATEPKHPKSLLIIDLKPLKLTRVRIDITPKFLAATAWGFVLVSEQGQIVLLDQNGNGLSRIEGLANPCAIAAFGEFGLLVATWNDGHGKLHTLNLKEFMPQAIAEKNAL